jgi:murein DD-endopeptidase MepM/ murein hydrolase activator NlpD
VRRAAILVAVAIAAAPGVSAAASLQVSAANLQQGGIVHGHAEPGTSVTANGREVPVAPDGRFIVGVGPDAPPALNLEAIDAAGATARISLSVGQREYQTQRVDGVPPETVTPDPAMLERIRREAEMVRAARRSVSTETGFDQQLAWPARGIITGVYGSRRILNGEPRAPHFGVDIAAPAGTPVIAAADGVVTLAAELFLTGNTVVIDHGLGFSTTYAHLSRLAVAPGARVRQGEAIGAVGATGRATAPHLHWGADWLDTRLDPHLIAGPMPPG